MNSKGFTLLELLVVIAVIGILASIIIASLGQARINATDVSIKSELRSLQVEEQLFYVLNPSFPLFYLVPETCTQMKSQAISANSALGNSSAVLAIITQVANIIGAAGDLSNGGSTDTATCAAAATPQWPAQWAVSVPLRSNPAKSWCVDSTGRIEQITGAVTDISCP